MKRATAGYMAVAPAPTTERPHRRVRAWGDTEEDALIALAARLLEEGAPMTGEAEVYHMTEENIA